MEKLAATTASTPMMPPTPDDPDADEFVAASSPERSRSSDTEEIDTASCRTRRGEPGTETAPIQ